MKKKKNKSKRNVLIIFIYIILTELLFLPCNTIEFNYSGEDKDTGKKYVFIPFFIDKYFEYLKFSKWKINHLIEIQNNLNEINSFDSLIEKMDIEGIVEYLIEERNKRVERNSELLGLFSKEFGWHIYDMKPFYYKLRFEQFVTQIFATIFLGGFIFVLFCIILIKKGEKKMKTKEFRPDKCEDCPFFQMNKMGHQCKYYKKGSFTIPSTKLEFCKVVRIVVNEE